jgi:hypothetical protein
MKRAGILKEAWYLAKALFVAYIWMPIEERLEKRKKK